MVAVTGATGHLGSVLVRTLLETGHSVRYLARPGSEAPGLDGSTAERIDGGLFDPEALERLLEGAGSLIHAAGHISLVRRSGSHLYRVNVEGTRAVCAAAQRAKTRRLVYVGSIEAFPLADGTYPITEEHGIDPDRTVMEYGRTKALGARLVLDAAGDGLDRVVCCPTAFLGPPDHRRSSLGRFVLDYLHRRLPAYVDGGFDFVDVRDVADGIAAAVDVALAPTDRSEARIYLLGGHYVPVPRFIELLERITGIPRPSLRLPIRVIRPLAPLVEQYYRLTGGEPRFTRGSLELLSLGVTVDSTRARRELGYESRPIETTIRDTVEWFSRNGAEATGAPE